MILLGQVSGSREGKQHGIHSIDQWCLAIERVRRVFTRTVEKSVEWGAEYKHLQNLRMSALSSEIAGVPDRIHIAHIAGVNKTVRL